MAAAVLTTTIIADNVMNMGDVASMIVQFAFTGAAATYPTGGYPMTAATFGLNKLAGMEQIASNTAGLQTDVFYDSQVAALKMVGTTAGAAGTLPNQELAASQQITGFTFTFRVWGQR